MRLFLVIFLVSFLLRLAWLDFPLHNSEPLRDYLVARHIIHYGEIPLTGPCCLWNSTFGLVPHSPFYYYLLAVLVAIRDDMVFLNLVNLLGQMLVLLVVYLVAKRLFGAKVAVVAAILFSLSWEVFKQSLFIWQPHFAQVALWAAIGSLLLAWERKSTRWFLAAVVLYLTAGAIHASVWGLLPAVAVALVRFLARAPTGHRLRLVGGTLLVVGISLAVLYGPLMRYLLTHRDGLDLVTKLPTAAVVPTLSAYAAQLGTVGSTLGSSLFPDKTSSSVSIVLLLFVGLSWLGTLSRGNREDRRRLLVLTGVISQFLLVAAIFQSAVWSFYLTPIWGVLAMAAAKVLAPDSGSHRWETVGRVVLLVFLVKGISVEGMMLRERPAFGGAPVVAAASAAIVQQAAGRPFSVRVFAERQETPVHQDLILWVPLEQALGRKLLTVGDSQFGYLMPSHDEVLFVGCIGNGPSGERWGQMCLGQFAREYPTHRVGEAVFAQFPITVYRATTNLDQQVVHYKALIARVGPVAAQEALYRSGLPFTGQTHLLNHTVGDILYEQYGPQGIVYCRDYFLSSCYHGLLIRAIGDGGMGKLTEAMEVCYRQGPTVSIQCAHAIGHGILAWEGYANLLTALVQCGRVKEDSPNFPLYNCQDGVFMENVWAVHEGGNLPSKDAWLKSDDLVYPCNDPRIPHQYLKACWSNQPMRIYQMSRADVTAMGRVCLGVRDPLLQATCFDGAARQIHPVARGQADEVLRLCALLPRDWQVACVASIVRAEFSVGGRTLPFTICEKVWQAGKEGCYRALSEIIRAYITDPSEREKFCSKLPLQIQRQCLVTQLRGYGGGVP